MKTLWENVSNIFWKIFLKTQPNFVTEFWHFLLFILQKAPRKNNNAMAEHTEVVSVRSVSYTGKYLALDSLFYNQQERKDAVRNMG